MNRVLITALALIGLIWPDSGMTHNRSESFSRWQYSDQVLSMQFTVASREASRSSTAVNEHLLGMSLIPYLQAHIEIDPACQVLKMLHPIPSRPGFLRVAGEWHCSNLPESISISTFFDLDAEHAHFASFETTAGVSQQFLSAENTQLLLQQNSDDNRSREQAFSDYVRHGFRHIISGLDHIVFLLALLLLCQRPKTLLWAITGFTIGHSLSLALSSFGLVQVNIPAIEATIGLTIVLTAVERTSLTLDSAIVLAVCCAGLLLLLIPVSLYLDSGIGKLAIFGMALFSFCYLVIGHDLGNKTSFRIIITTLFGLIHGFGFASAFIAAQMGGSLLILPLAGFNIGVELGQIVLLGGLISLSLMMQKWTPKRFPTADLATAVVCGFGVFWFLQRSF